MAMTRLQMAQEVTRILGNRTDLSTATYANLVRYAYQHLTQVVRFPEAYATATLNFTSGVNNDAWPSDFFSPIVLRNDQTSKPVTQVSPQNFDALDWTVEGDFKTYMLYGGSVYVHPTPDGADTATLRYRKYFADLSADGTAHALPVIWDRIIIDQAVSMGFDDLNEVERAQYFQARVDGFIRRQLDRLDEMLFDLNEPIAPVGGEITLK